VKKDKLSEWKKLIGEWERSGKTRQAFCKEKGLSMHTFSYWRTQVRRDKPVNGKFVQVSPNGSTEPLEIKLAGGTVIKVPNRFDRGTLKNLLEVLQ
jgi:hypothetical protein